MQGARAVLAGRRGAMGRHDEVSGVLEVWSGGLRGRADVGRGGDRSSKDNIQVQSLSNIRKVVPVPKMQEGWAEDKSRLLYGLHSEMPGGSPSQPLTR